MSQPFNIEMLHTYSSKFATKVCEIIFSEKDLIKGEDLMSVTPVEQVNLFVISKIFETWQKEAVRVQLPYFDYESEDVQEALLGLMEILSKNISIKRVYFEPLLKQAVYDTLMLGLSPKTYFEQFFENLSEEIPVEGYLTPLFAYFRVYASLAQEIIHEIRTTVGDRIGQEEAITLSLGICEKYNSDESQLEELLAILGEIVPLKKEELFIQQQEKKAANPLDFVGLTGRKFSNVTAGGNIANVSNKTAPLEKPKEIVQEETPEPTTSDYTTEAQFIPIVDEPVEEPEGTLSTTKVETPVQTQEEVVGYREEPEHHFTKEIQEETERPFINTAQEVKPVVADTIQSAIAKTIEEAAVTDWTQEQKQEKTVWPEMDHPSRQKTLKDRFKGSFGSRIALNQRFYFTEKLFNNSKTELVNAIRLIDESNTYSEAIKHIRNNFARKYEWDLTEDTTKEFLMMVEEHF
ncbi:hypothetical protein [Algivirga pacifica]|uniref:Uncharacterized protein n=1 Tax=Algivirga pacifica TaxID=1162670 RepID=A0ABP9DC25_9BACT